MSAAGTEIAVIETRELAVPVVIPAMAPEAIEKVRQFEQFMLTLPQVPIVTQHHIHAGLYARTVFLPAGVTITGVLIKIATLLIVHGDAIVYIGEQPLELSGYNVVPAAAGRKQAFYAKGDVWLTMMFATEHRSVEDVEHQFTDEFDLLASHKDEDLNRITITGE